METLFDSAALPAAQRSEAWLETTSKALLTTQVEISDSATFQARLRAMNVGAAQMSSMSYGPLLSRRTPRLIRQSDPEQYQIALVRSGHQSIDQTDSHACLGRGELVFYDSSRPFTARVGRGEGGRRGGSDSVLMQFPKRLLPLPRSGLARMLATPLSGTEGVGSLLAQFMVALADREKQYTPQDKARLGGIALDLATSTLAHHLDSENAHPARLPQSVLFLRATSFIGRHLHVPELGPSAVAASLQISLRYLHRVFQQHGTSVSAYIRHQRLDRCRRDLADPSLNHLAICSIAGRWGFPRPAEFTRAFRAAMQMPPSQYRAEAQADVSGSSGSSSSGPEHR
ncbi:MULTISPECIES: helix-turn-helix domain-containing protein [unclassified Streptomyces]|uniref:AraC-like ligand-binding domain-containing protein n=1 Tax=unclassified Streptomyces TaxID=2593676 RepID=UPI002E1F2726|nr:helix-turn-helix domain-containing protein [Streptomyces sp. NBC_01023]